MKNKRKQKNNGVTRILIVNLEGKIGGAEKSLLLLVKYLHRRVEIIAACPNPSLLAQRLNELEVKIFGILSSPRRFNWTLIWLCYFIYVNFQLMLIHLKAKPAIIHANNSKAVLASVLATVFTESKLIWHARDMGRYTLVSRICAYLCSQIIAVSNTVKKSLIDKGVKETLIVVVYNSIEIKNQQLPLRNRLNKKTTTFANIGQFVPWKKQDLFLDAAVDVLNKGEKAEFMIIGDDIFGRDAKYKNNLLDKLENNSFTDKITFWGWQQDSEQLWDRIDCLVHTADKEPFGRVIIEAMSRGLPVIAANSCGPAEIIEDGLTGLLFKPDDVKDLSRAMQKIAQDTIFARKLALAGQRQVVSKFRPEDTAKKINVIYEKVLAA